MADWRNKVLYCDVREGLAGMPDGCVQCVVTSPPYWGLRKYAGEQDVDWSDGWRGALGLEPQIEMYIAHIVQIFREVRRVLRKDGVCFVNIGDAYNTMGGKGRNRYFDGRKDEFAAGNRPLEDPRGKEIGLKNKDLCLIPARLALALQADGWYVRSDIIWVKPNPMPESVTDRPSKSYDHILMLTKSARYYYDSEAIKEKYTEPLNRWGGPVFRESSHKYIEMGGHDGKQQYGATSMFREGRPVRPNESGRNCRDTWIFPTVGYSGAHFAVFPPELPRRCILAGSSHKACPKCGSPWKRITRPDYRESPRPPTSFIRQQNPQGMGRSPGFAKHGHATKIAETLGWQPTCSCSENDGSGRCLILDPFAGSGTTLAVAAQLGRDYCGIEIAEEYKSLIDKRLKRVRKA